MSGTRTPSRVVIALGGNALEGAPGDVRDQAAAAKRALSGLRSLLDVDHLLISHGNGPQVGTLMLRTEAPVMGFPLPALPLDICVADTIGGLGYTLGRELRSVLGRDGSQREVAAIITTTLVGDLDDAPRKAVGPSCSDEDVARLQAIGWQLRQDERGRVRRVVPSPEPLAILEMATIRWLFDTGIAVIAGGGGGVPVSQAPDGRYEGVAAVVDKDLVSAFIASELEADLLMILTDIDGAFSGFRTSDERPVGRIGAAELRALLGSGVFGEGSMAPKVAAACRFVESGGSRAVICHLERATEGYAGLAGTQVIAS